MSEHGMNQGETELIINHNMYAYVHYFKRINAAYKD